MFNNEVRSPIAIMVQHDTNIETSDIFTNWELINKNYTYNNLSKQQELQINHLLLEELPKIDHGENKNHFLEDLTKISQSSQKIYKLTKAHHWRKAQLNNKKLQNVVKDVETEFPPKTIEFKKLTAKINLLDKAITNKDSQLAMRNSNQITFLVAKMSKRFLQKVPVEVTLLNYYERELEIWIPVGNKPWLRKTAKNVTRTWLYIRPLVLAHGDKKEVHKFDILVSSLSHASSFNDYIQTTTLLQKEQDTLERVFQ